MRFSPHPRHAASYAWKRPHAQLEQLKTANFNDDDDSDDDEEISLPEEEEAPGAGYGSPRGGGSVKVPTGDRAMGPLPGAGIVSNA